MQIGGMEQVLAMYFKPLVDLYSSCQEQRPSPLLTPEASHSTLRYSNDAIVRAHTQRAIITAPGCPN